MTKLIQKAPLALAAAALLAAGAAHAQTVKIKIADSFPVGHYLPKYVTTPMIERLKANPAAKGIEFEYYPAEQMGKA
ncbi:MAG: C4-dicarboxylate transporter, partial [Ramlibacter sp.]|nr:C4-dicarboxylate transporter [Ramlibacter sp.]